MAVHEVDCSDPGIARVGAGRGFFYRDADGLRVEDPDVLHRIKALAIPPAWNDVWICSDPAGHIQATGVDARGRRQYRYHDEWQDRRSREKHDRVLRLAQRLPELRAQVDRDLRLDGLPRERVLACAVRLLELGCFRTGGESYAEENGSRGLATLLKGQVRIRGAAVEFDYEAKGGQRRRCRVADRGVTEVVAALKRRRAPAEADLLAYRGDDGTWVDVRSEDINSYLHAILGDGFSAKDLRTWAATVLAAVAFAEQEPPESDREYAHAEVEVVAEVADHLGNTPAVARSAYIDPRVVERFEAGDTLADPSADDAEAIEADVVELIGRAG